MKRFLFNVTAIIHTIYMCAACNGSTTGQASDEQEPSNAFPYQIHKPDDRYLLPGELDEVSGIAYMKDGVLASVQDEKGIIYMYDTKSTAVIDRIRFSSSGDFEDIAVAGDKVYVLRSDGQLYRLSLTGETAPETYDTPLSEKNDVEGLAYDRANNRLLLACKGISGSNTDDPDNRAVYTFDLETNVLQQEPIFRISVKDIKILSGSKDNFRPSGIAIHPISGLVYVVASVGKVLVVLNKNGSIETVQPLPARYFRQPEGICFAPNGDMFISNEGRGSMASILRYNLTP